MDPVSNRWAISTRCRIVFFGLLMSASGLAPKAFCQTDNWLGGTDLWGNAAKWSTGVPGSTSNVFIDHGLAGASSVTINYNGAQCANLTIDGDDNLTLADGTIFTLHGPTISNAGKISLNAAGFGAYFNFGGAVTLTGAGTLNMSNNSSNYLFGYGQPSPGASLTNEITIQGAGQIGGNGGIGAGNTFNNSKGGKINANQSATPFVINVGNGNFGNTGTLEATNGATLALDNGTITNTGGTIHAGPNSIVSLYNMTISGGMLTTSGSGTFKALCCLGYSTLDGVTINGAFQWVSNNIGYLHGMITNNGPMSFSSPTGTNVVLDVNGAVTLKGSGTLTSTNPNNAIMAYAQTSPGASLTNQSTIQGTGQFGGVGGIGVGNSLINDTMGTIFANQKTSLVINVLNGTFTNRGTLKVKTGTTMYIAGAGFTNFSGTTLTGGKYLVNGTLEFDGANIVNNAASITLTGAHAGIINQSAVNALTHFATNTSTGSFSLVGGALLTIQVGGGNFTNVGKIAIGKGSGFQVSTPAAYTQTGSTASTTIDGVLMAATGVTINSGQLFGNGTIAASLTSSAAVTAGDSLNKAGRLSPSTYVQKATGSLNVQIGGKAAGTQYSQLAVVNGASLDGTLKVTLINHFTPAIGDVFTILTTSARSGQFKTTNLPPLSGAHWVVTYDTTKVTLTVASAT